jgi:hypothetical protein
VEDFDWGTGTTFNICRIDPAFGGFGFSHVGNTNNINLKFDFTSLGFTANRVEFEFADLGGTENISVNGQPVTVGELTAAPAAIAPGVSFHTMTIPITGGKEGMGILIGSVQTLVIGGQEFWLDNICAWDTLATGIEESSGPVSLPSELTLDPNYPNPFNPETEIRYSLPDADYVLMAVYDTRGRHIRTLTESYQPAGRYTVRWNGTDDRGSPVPSGIYMVRIQAGTRQRTIKLTLIR